MHHVVSTFFRLKGRATRPEYWLLTILMFVPLAFVSVLPPFELASAASTIVALALLFVILSTVAGFVTVAVRRAHDRGMSGYWVLVFYGLPPSAVSFAAFAQSKTTDLVGLLAAAVPLLWGLIELGFFPGTRGPNNYGPDPRTSGPSSIGTAISRSSFPLLATIGVSSALGSAVAGREDIATLVALVTCLGIAAHFSRQTVQLLRIRDGHPPLEHGGAYALAISLRAVAMAALIFAASVAVLASAVNTFASPGAVLAHQEVDRVAVFVWAALPSALLWLLARLLLHQRWNWLSDALLFVFASTFLLASVAVIVAMRSLLAQPFQPAFLPYNWLFFCLFTAFFSGLALIAHFILSRRARSDRPLRRTSRIVRGLLFVPRGIALILIVLVPLVVARMFLFLPSHLQSGYVSGITPGSYMFVAKYAYGYSRYSLPFAPKLFDGRVLYRSPRRGDIAVVRLDDDKDLVARVLGLPGEKIARRGRIVYVDGQPLPQVPLPLALNPGLKGYRETLPNGLTYIIYGPPQPAREMSEQLVPQGHVLLIHDARSDQDLTVGRLVPLENLLGRVALAFGQSTPVKRPFETDKIAALLNKVPDRRVLAPEGTPVEPPVPEAATTGPAGDCNSEENTRKLSGCSALITEGKLLPAALAVAHSRRSDAQLEAGNLNEAIADRMKALQFQPEDAEYKTRLAKAYVLRAATWPLPGKADTALRDYGEAIRILPTNHEAYVGRSSIHLLKEDYDSAIADLRTALKHHEAGKDAYRSALSRIYKRRGEVQLLKKDLDQAITSLTESIGLASPQGAPYKQRAHAYVQKGQTELALKDYSEAIRFNPDDLDAYVGRGEIYRAQRMFPLALQDFDKVLSHRPSNVMARMLRALTREEAKDPDGAIADYQAVLEFEPKHRLAKAGIERLRAYIVSTVPDDSPTKSESLAAPKGKATNETEPRAKQGCFVFNGKRFCN
jgi:signal peptidase I